MLFVHEIHQVIGSRAHDFESTYRQEWVPALARDGDARLLWYANHAHLTCYAYHVLTITALRDGAAWLRLAARIHAGDLLEPVRALDQLRHDVDAKLLLAERGSPLRGLDLTDVPLAATEHATALFIEDTFHTQRRVVNPPDDEMAEPVAAFGVAHPQHGGDEQVAWRRVRRPELLLASLTDAGAPSPGHAGIEHHESRLWRVSSWSPLA